MKKSTIHLATCSIGLGLLMSACYSNNSTPLFAVDETMAPPFELNMQADPQPKPVKRSSFIVKNLSPKETNTNVAPATAEDAPETNNITPKDSVNKEYIEPAPSNSMLARTVPTVYRYTPNNSTALSAEEQLSQFCQEVAGKVYYELKQNNDKHLTSRVAVVDAVPLSDLKRETEFGRLVSEYMLTDLADRGLKVTELRLGREINILPQTGEFILSRNIGELASDAPMLDYVMVSTFTNTRKTLILQGRLVSLKSGLVETSWRYTLPLSRDLLGLFHDPERPFTIAVNGINR